MFSYRYNRLTYWALCAPLLIISMVLSSLGKGSLLSAIVLIILATPRLHDIGRSGWIAVGAVIFLNLLALGAFLAGATFDLIVIAAGVLLLILLSLLGAIPGDSDNNEWGEPPPSGIHFRRQTPYKVEVAHDS